MVALRTRYGRAARRARVPPGSGLYAHLRPFKAAGRRSRRWPRAARWPRGCPRCRGSAQPSWLPSALVTDALPAGRASLLVPDCTPISADLQRLDDALVEGQPPVHTGGKRRVMGGDESAEAGVPDQLKQQPKDLVGGVLVEV